jgi:hypothetical protein
MYVMPEGCNADVALTEIHTLTFGCKNINNAYLSNQIGKNVVSCKSVIFYMPLSHDILDINHSKQPENSGRRHNAAKIRNLTQTSLESVDTRTYWWFF